MVICSAIGCSSRPTRDKEQSFHRFPHVTDSRYNIWCRNVKRSTKNGGRWLPSKVAVLCSKHFTPDQFIAHYDGATLRRLKPHAIPTIFSFGHIIETQNKRKTRVSMEASQIPQLLEKIELPPIKLADRVLETFETETYHDHPYYPKRSDLCKRICNLEETIGSLRKKLKKINKQNYLKGKKIGSLISSLLDQKKLSGSLQKKLKAFEKLDLKLFKRDQSQYTDEMKRFAISTKLHSTKAYEYVRDEFRKCGLKLPSARTVSGWVLAIDANPGVTDEAIQFLFKKRNEANGYQYRWCSLVFDEMSVMEKIEWNKA